MIVMQNVRKEYMHGVVALNNVSVEIPERDFIFLVGPSGAGKSTFIKLLIRQEIPTSGRVFIGGQDIARLRRHHVPWLRRKVGIIFQDYKLLPNKTVYENVAFALQVLGENKRVIQDAVPSVLALVGLSEKAQRFPNQLSGGEQQRVAIARSIVHQPQVLVADEPTGNLDPTTGWEIIQLLTKVNALGTTMVIATHNREIVDVMRRRVIAIEGGRIVRDESEGGYHYEA